MVNFKFGRKREAKRFLLYRKLALLIANGLSPIQAFEKLAQISDDRAVGIFCQGIVDKIHSGHSIADALLETDPLLDSAVSGVLAHPTEAAIMAEGLYELADTAEAAADYWSAAKTAMIYPVKIMTIAVLLWCVIFAYVIPVFKDIFSDTGSHLPVLTSLVISISDFCRDYIVPILIILIVLAAAVFKSNRIRYLLMTGFPGARSLIRGTTLIRYLRSLSVLLRCGLPLGEALERAAQTVTSKSHAFKLAEATRRVTRTSQLKEAWDETRIFPQEILSMVEIGEVEIPVAPLLHHMAVYFEKGFDRRARRTIQSMELYAFFIVAVVIGTMVVAMYQPLFKMAGTV